MGVSKCWDKHSLCYITALYLPCILEYRFLFHVGIERYLANGPLSRGFVSCLVAPGPHLDHSSGLDDNHPCAGDQRRIVSGYAVRMCGIRTRFTRRRITGFPLGPAEIYRGIELADLSWCSKDWMPKQHVSK